MSAQDRPVADLRPRIDAVRDLILQARGIAHLAAKTCNEEDPDNDNLDAAALALRGAVDQLDRAFCELDPDELLAPMGAGDLSNVVPIR